MEMKDVNEITLAKAFNKKWWQDHRSPKAKGSGVGAALDAWQKTCPKSVSKLGEKEVAAAEETCELLEKALKTAIAKCGKDQKETVAGCKRYIELVEDYKLELAKQRKKLTVEMSEMLESMVTTLTGRLATAARDVAALKPTLDRVKAQVAEWERQAGEDLLEAAKQGLLQELGDGMAALDRLERDLALAAEDLNVETGKYTGPLREARKYRGVRAVLARAERELADFDVMMTRIYEDVSDVKTTIMDLLKRVDRRETADEGLHTLRALTGILKESPTFETFGNIFQQCRDWSKTLASFEANLDRMTEEHWTAVEQIGSELRDGLKQVPVTLAQVERTYKQGQALNRRWGHLEEAARVWAELEKAYQARQKAYADMSALAGEVARRLEGLLTQSR